MRHGSGSVRITPPPLLHRHGVTSSPGVCEASLLSPAQPEAGCRPYHCHPVSLCHATCSLRGAPRHHRVSVGPDPVTGHGAASGRMSVSPGCRPYTLNTPPPRRYVVCPRTVGKPTAQLGQRAGGPGRAVCSRRTDITGRTSSDRTPAGRPRPRRRQSRRWSRNVLESSGNLLHRQATCLHSAALARRWGIPDA